MSGFSTNYFGSFWILWIMFTLELISYGKFPLSLSGRSLFSSVLSFNQNLNSTFMLSRSENCWNVYWNFDSLQFFFSINIFRKNTDETHTHKYTWVHTMLTIWISSRHELFRPCLLQRAINVSKVLAPRFHFKKVLCIHFACYTRICFNCSRFVLLYFPMSRAIALGFFFDCVCHTRIYWVNGSERKRVKFIISSSAFCLRIFTRKSNSFFFFIPAYSSSPSVQFQSGSEAINSLESHPLHSLACTA